MNDANATASRPPSVKTPASGNPATTTQTYSIADGSNRLVSVAGTTDTTGAASTKTYQYDAAGAITSATTSGTTSGAQYLHYGANGRVAKVTGTASSTDPSAVSYLYNSASQRLLKTDARQSTTAPRTEHTLYSEEDSAQLLGTYSNRRSTSSAAPAGEMDSTEVIYLPTAQGMVPVAAQINGRLYAIHADHLSTPRRLTNQQGQVAWQWLLTGFGEVSPTTGAKGYVQADSPVAGSLPSYAPEVTFNLRYPGQQWDEETQLSYNVNRYYGPQEGRYIQADPIGLVGGWNRFAYVNGNPLNAIDPEGLQSYMCAAGLPAWCPPAPRPPGPREGSVRDFWRNNKDMREANTINADKYFHCKANCEAGRRGPAGEKMACLISDSREWFDQYAKGDPAQASADDQAANIYGRAWGSNTNLSCDIACGQYRPLGLPYRY